jgi:small subunit ribosomal protein S1
LEIMLAKNAGYCSGVKTAIQLLENLLAEGGQVYSLGPPIHNPRAVADLAARGLRVVTDLSEAVGNGRLVIRSHGAPPQIIREAQEKGLDVADATCRRVKQAQEAARELLDDGLDVIVVGDETHPEVIGIVGAIEGRATVVASADAVAALPPLGQVGVVAQTTQRPEVVAEIVAELRKKAKRLIFRDTLCPATARRQTEAWEMAHAADVMLVVGGRNSANTRKLAEICRQSGARTYLIEGPEEIDPAWFQDSDRVGITAGASTPDWLLKEVVAKMEETKDRAELGNTEELTAAAEITPEEATDVAETPEEDVGAPAAEAGDVLDPGDITMQELEPGQVTKGKVVQVASDHVLVDVGYKSEGVIPFSELSHREIAAPADVVSEGEEIDVYVLSVDNKEGGLLLSKKRADEESAWEYIADKYEKGEILTVPVIEEVKGGLVVDVGLRGFMPASHVERGYVSDLSKYVGQNVRVRVLELDQSKNRVILSQKVVLEEEYERMKEETWANISEGQVRHGTVKSITDFGAFIDLGGVDGLLHVSEMAWGRVHHPSEVVQIGEEIDVKVLRVDREAGRISLGLKQILPDPWQNVADKYPVDSVVEGRVVRLAPFGAFVELEPGVDGLVHISELADRRVATPDEVVQPGDQVKVKVLKVRPNEKRISLSLKEAMQDRERQVMEEYMDDRSSSSTGGVTLGEMLGDLANDMKERVNAVSEEADD